MKSVLEQLYNGEIIPIEQHRPILEEYRNCFQKREKAFTNKLDESLKKEFDVLIDEYLTSFPVEMAQEYMNGFKLGARLMCEIFAEQKGNWFEALNQ